jgi:hypothetical protein
MQDTDDTAPRGMSGLLLHKHHIAIPTTKIAPGKLEPHLCISGFSFQNFSF